MVTICAISEELCSYVPRWSISDALWQTSSQWKWKSQQSHSSFMCPGNKIGVRKHLDAMSQQWKAASFSFRNIILSPWRQTVLEQAFPNNLVMCHDCVDHFLNNVNTIYNTTDIWKCKRTFLGPLSTGAFQSSPTYTLYKSKMDYSHLTPETLTVAGLRHRNTRKGTSASLFL